MLLDQPLTCILIGETSLLLRCAEILLSRSYRLLAIVTSDKTLRVDCPVFPCLAEAISLLEQRPDLLFSIANPSILSPAEIIYPRLATVNYHDSPLPSYAGVNAPSWAIFHGEASHGISWHRIDPCVDGGDILIQHIFAIDAEETALSLSIKCVHHAVLGFMELLDQIEADDLVGVPQDLSRRTYFSRYRRLPRQGILNWSDDAASICRFVRSGQLSPHANDFGLPKILWPDGMLVIVGEIAVEAEVINKPYGTIVDCDSDFISVVAGDGVILRLGSLLTINGHPFVCAASMIGARLACLDAWQVDLIASATAAAAEQEEAIRALMADLPAPLHPRPLRPFKFQENGEHVFSQRTGDATTFGQAVAAVLQRLLTDTNSSPVLLGLHQPCPVGFLAIRPLICRPASEPELALLIDRELASTAIPEDLPIRFPDLAGSKLHLRSLSVCLSAEPDPAIANPGLLICCSGGVLSLRFDASQIDTRDAAELAAYLLGHADDLPPRFRADADHWRSIPRQISEQARLMPGATAIEFGSERLTYEELDWRATALAARLRPHAAGCERRYALLLPQGIDFPIAAIAVLRAGAAFIPLDISAPLPQLRRILHDARPLAVLTVSACRPLAEQLGCTVLDCDSDLLPCMPLAETEQTPDDLAYVIYTSGSTGEPKGCMIEHHSICWFIDQIIARHNIGPDDRILQLCAITFDASVEEIFSALCAGATLVIRPRSLLESPENYLDFCELAGLTIVGLYVSLLPKVLHAMEHRGRFPPTVRIVTTGGEIVPAASVERWRSFFAEAGLPAPRLLNVYGLTETTVANVLADLSSPCDLTDGVPIGNPLPGTKVRIVDDNLVAVPPGAVGELLLSGPQLARGYWNRPALTELRFLRDSDDGTRWFRTGDLVRVAASGELIVVGRSDRQVQLNGIRVELEGIEKELLAHPWVAQAVVVLDREAHTSPLLVAYWVPRPGRSLPLGALHDFLADCLPTHALPAAFIPVPSIPLTTSGKPDTRSLPSPKTSRPSENQVSSLAETHSLLHGLWAEVLGHTNYGYNDHFFIAGGDSLAAARLVSLFNEHLRLKIPVAAIYRCPTIAEQVHWLETHASSVPSIETSGNLVTLQPHGSLPPLFIVHGWGGSVGGYVDLARAFAPERPVMGLQASDADLTGCPPASVEAMAESYAEQILAAHMGMPIHLLGYSTGGWYAHAVASALLKRGGSLGLFAVLDTHSTARIHRRLGVMLLVATIVPRLIPRLQGLLVPPQGQRRRKYLKDRLQAFKQYLAYFLRIQLASPSTSSFAAAGSSPASNTGDLFAQIAWNGYRPARLPIMIDVFAPQSQLATLRVLWRFYGRAGVRCHPIFREHHDFWQPERMPQLAQVLQAALRHTESCAEP
ncbi:MAG: amino acid adenylation domain-containing protein [Synechococcaceae cyanobacterium ELA739]